MYKKVLNRYLHAQRPDKAASEIGLSVIVIMALAPVVLLFFKQKTAYEMDG